MQDNRARLEAAVAHWNAGRLDDYLGLYSPDVRLHGLQPGLDAVRAMYQEVWGAFPGSQLVLEDVIVEGERLACRYTWRARSAETGEPVETPGLTIMHFGGGRCSERWDFEGTEQNVA